MKRYRCHKVVEAARIVEIEWFRDRVRTDDGEWHTVPLQGARLMVGWYLVRYADGYVSASPPEPFEEGYRPIGEQSVPMPQSVDEARAMALLGYAWLRDNAPDQLKGVPA